MKEKKKRPFAEKKNGNRNISSSCEGPFRKSASMFGMSGGLRPWMSAGERARWYAVREAVIAGRHVSSIVDLEDRLFEADTEKRRLEGERDAARAAVAELQAQVRGLERDKQTLAVQAWETKHIYR